MRALVVGLVLGLSGCVTLLSLSAAWRFGTSPLAP